MSKTSVIAVFDVGKTNKKLFLFNEQYEIVYERSHQFDEIKDEDGDPCENLQALTDWGRNSFAALNQLRDFDIHALNFSAYGASFVHVDKQGNANLPLYNYLKPFPRALKEEFFEKYGGEELMALETASPVLESLNSGLQLYRLLKQHRITNSNGYSLHLPQYLSFLITGKMYSDITSIGCHTMMWDFENNRYHRWVEQEGLTPRMAPLFSSSDVISSRAHWKDFIVGVGLHDSSAALIPYLSAFHQPFVLISTGTWCISLNPFNDSPLTPAQLSQDCLCYMSYLGKPVKASRLFAGYEHEQQVKRLAEHFHKSKNYFETVAFSSRLIEDLPHDRTPVSLSSSGFERRDLNHFPNYEAAYHQFLSDIIRQQTVSTNLVMEGKAVKRIFVDGGFGRNMVYMNLLARSFPDLEVYAASVPQATAMGAALAIHSHWNQRELPADLIGLKHFSGHTAVKPL
jgi:sugar (pentulose or hexulose) kinase